MAIRESPVSKGRKRTKTPQNGYYMHYSNTGVKLQMKIKIKKNTKRLLLPHNAARYLNIRISRNWKE